MPAWYLCIYSIAQHKLCEASGFFKCTYQAGPTSLAFSQAWATGSLWGAKPTPSNKAVSTAVSLGLRTIIHSTKGTSSTLQNKGPGSRRLRVQPGALDSDNLQFPISAYGRGKYQRSTGQAEGQACQTDSRSHMLKQHLRRMLKTKCLKASWEQISSHHLVQVRLPDP